MTRGGRESQEAGGCEYVARYLERFLDEGARSSADLDQIGEHAAQCPRCYGRLAHFFRTIELPESSYLRETLDELALSLFNLARAIIRDRPPDASEAESAVLAITSPGGGSENENRQSGVEMIEDAEDYVGSSVVGGMDLSEFRSLLADAERAEGLRVDLALGLFRRITQMDCRYVAQAWNWIGALNYRREDLAEAEAAFLNVLAQTEGVREVRSFAHCTLAYIFKHRGDLTRAVRAAHRSLVLAEEDGMDTYFGIFAEIYLRLLRKEGEDLEAAEGLVRRLQAEPRDWERFCTDIQAQANAPVLVAWRASPLAARFPLATA